MASQQNIIAVHDDGLHVLLDDGTSWDISPGQSTKVLLWYETQRVKVEEDKGEYWLTNLDTSEPDKVPARPGYWDPDDAEDD